LTNGGGSYNAVWSPDGQLLAFTERENLVVYDVATGATELLPCPDPSGCHAVASSDTFSTEPWSADSQHLLYVTGPGAQTPQVQAVLVWDRSTDKVRTLATPAGGARASPDGSQVLVTVEAGLELLDVGSGAIVKSYGQNGISVDSDEETTPSAWSADGRYVTGWHCDKSGCGGAVMSVATGTITDIPNGGGFEGWRRDAPVWCAYATGGLDCGTYDPELGIASVTHIASYNVLGVEDAGYYSEISGSTGTSNYAVAAWTGW
jgi:dipeptidyl aminopeptidase/acylaminoacyl peptidase